jgi:hypothetical protein
MQGVIYSFFFLLNFVNCRLRILSVLVCVVKSRRLNLPEELAQDKRNVSTTEERKHALTRLYELCWSVIFAVLLDVISLACTSGRVPIAHLISEKALGLRGHVGTGQTCELGRD